MRQLKMVQDWGYDYIYLRHMETTTRANVRDHNWDIREEEIQVETIPDMKIREEVSIVDREPEDTP